jgi:hypothetical protein
MLQNLTYSIFTSFQSNDLISKNIRPNNLVLPIDVKSGLQAFFQRKISAKYPIISVKWRSTIPRCGEMTLGQMKICENYSRARIRFFCRSPSLINKPHITIKSNVCLPACLTYFHFVNFGNFSSVQSRTFDRVTRKPDFSVGCKIRRAPEARLFGKEMLKRQRVLV